MSWKHTYLQRAQSLAAMSPWTEEYHKLWGDLEDDILGKLSLDMAADLFDFAMTVPCQGSMVLMCMMPDDLPTKE